MNTTEEKVYAKIKKDIAFDDEKFSLEKLIHMQAHAKVYNFLKSVVSNVGCHDYLFIFAITKLEERHGKFMQPYLVEILDNYCNYPDLFDRDVAFAAFYNLGLHYTRYYEINNLYNHLVVNSYFSMFHKEYPLCYEMAARYCMLKGMFDRQMLLCRCAVKKLKELREKNPERFTQTQGGYVQTGDNVALKVGYISSICSMFEQSYVRGQLGEERSDTKASISALNNLSPAKLKQFLRDDKEEDQTNGLLNDYSIAEACEYVDQAIAYNPTYPKYPFLKAQLLFYSALYRNEEITSELLQKIQTLTEKAKSLENSKANDYDLRCANYDRLISRVQASMTKNTSQQDKKQRLHYLKLKDEIIRMTECPPPQKRPPVTAQGDEPYAFISYSTRDFKYVYCDLLEMQCRGFSYWYDAKVIPGEKWHRVIESKIKGASCVICFLSSNFLMSAAVLKELTLLKKFNKPIIWVDLTGKKQISKIIIEVIKSANKDTLAQMNSEMLNILTDLLNDDIDLIVRDNDPLSSIHLNRIESVLEDKFPLLIRNFTVDSLSVVSNKIAEREGKTMRVPNEDYVLCDNANRIYMVVDGISRKRDEYFLREGSIAADVSALFCNSIHKYLREKLTECNTLAQAQLILKEGFIQANKQVKIMLDTRQSEYAGRELPGTVGIVAFIYNKTLCYGSFGDCMGIMVRNDQQIIFAQKQTAYAFEKLKVEHNRALLAKKFVNVENAPFGYGVANGQESAAHYFKISHIDLERGDTVYLVSDGVSDLIQYAKPQSFNDLTLEEIIKLSDEQDDALNKPTHDDKSIIRIRINE